MDAAILLKDAGTQGRAWTHGHRDAADSEQQGRFDSVLVQLPRNERGLFNHDKQ